MQMIKSVSHAHWQDKRQWRLWNKSHAATM